MDLKGRDFKSIVSIILTLQLPFYNQAGTIFMTLQLPLFWPVSYHFYDPSGTIILWLYWPSFNALLVTEDARHRLMLQSVLESLMDQTLCMISIWFHSCLTDYVVTLVIFVSKSNKDFGTQCIKNTMYFLALSIS